MNCAVLDQALFSLASTTSRVASHGVSGCDSPPNPISSPVTWFIAPYSPSLSAGIKRKWHKDCQPILVEAASSNIFKHKEFNLESLGIGGLRAEFADIFRRAFASRVFPPHVTSSFTSYLSFSVDLLPWFEKSTTEKNVRPFDQTMVPVLKKGLKNKIWRK